MATLIKLEIDSVAYEYSKWMWKMLAGEKPESAVFKLSSGKGLTASSVSTISDKINLLMSKLEQFAPTAFLSPEDGKTFRKKIADWYGEKLKEDLELEFVPKVLKVTWHLGE